MSLTGHLSMTATTPTSSSSPIQNTTISTQQTQSTTDSHITGMSESSAAMNPNQTNSEKPKMMVSPRFEPAIHLNHVYPAKVYTMEEIGLGDKGISTTAVSEPFPLFTPQAIEIMREEVLSANVFRHHNYSNNITPYQLRGYAKTEAPFIYSAFHHPATLDIVSKIAGTALVPVMDYEVGHVNIALKDVDRLRAEAFAKEQSQNVEAPPNSPETVTMETPEHSEDESSNADSDAGVAIDEPRSEPKPVAGDEKPIVAWHTDSYPFVVVLMLSDCTNMVGGETALRTGSGEVMKVRGPAKGHAVVLQGRYIEHQALKTIGSAERVTMVTSFRAQDPNEKDDTVLTTVRSCSDLGQLYGQYAHYRLELMEKRIAAMKAMVDKDLAAGRQFNIQVFDKFVKTSQASLEATAKEIVHSDEVSPTVDAKEHLRSADLIQEK